jgi:hypothetical protein
VAIDALGAVVDKLPGRLGEAESTMRDALNQIRLAYVAIERARREAEVSTEADVPTEQAVPEPSAAEDGEPGAG